MKVAIYVVSRQAKQAYAEESFAVRKWPGVAIIKDALNRAGISVGYCGVTDAHQFDVVLVSITAACDWWPFLAERQRWQSGKQVTIVGGAGVLNVRPFLWAADCFVFGRAENFVSDLVREAASGREYEHESVCWSESFSVSKKYKIASGEVYSHPVVLEDGAKWQEIIVGCQNSCLFCGYTWHRKNNGKLHSAGTADKLLGGGAEKTLLELDMGNPSSWDLPRLRIVAIDGFSERLRKKVNKPISREKLRLFFSGLAQATNPHQLKIYNLVGLPSESREDWREFIDDLHSVDSRLPAGKQWSIVLHNTPFRAMPATPAAHWHMSYENYRGEIAKALRKPAHKGNIFYQGKRFWCVESMGTDSLSTHILDAIIWRGIEADEENVKKLSRLGAFWSASAAIKKATLEKYFDCKRLFQEYKRGEEPTAYLRSWWHNDPI